MRSARVVFAVTAVALLALSACSRDRAPTLMNVRSETNGPDEFSILPPRALEMPEDLTALPEPTLGGTNRTDPQPFDDAIIALGGKPGVGSTDSALVAFATRNGVSAGIRETLAAEDLEWRKQHDGRLLERVFNVNVYFKAYLKMSLDQQAELLRWRQAGARTPSAPPPQKGE